MKKHLLTILMALVTTSCALAQYPINTYIVQEVTNDPATNYTHMYTQWRHGTQNVGFMGYGSNNGTVYLYNEIGDVQIQSTKTTGNIVFSTNNSQVMRITHDGKVAIGRDNARWALDVEGSIGAKQSLWLKANSTQSTEIILEKQNQSYYSIGGNDNAFTLYNHSTQKRFFHADAADRIGIGTDPVAGYQLAVGGIILSEKVKVKQQPWPDYVFEPAYKLPSLAELEAFVQKNKHLPGVPSAKEVAENGLDLGSTQAALLEKIEELTLIIIEQNKKLEAQEKRLQTIEKKLP